MTDYECAMCGTTTEGHVCPKCKKPLCIPHATAQISKKGEVKYYPGQDCGVPLSVLKIARS
jgi:hypothetical protein